MYIFRAGMTGCLAAFIFPKAQILEPASEVKRHKAVLRFRSDDISKLTGIPFRKVKVTKGIWYQGESVQPSIQLSNMYSMKVSNGLMERSIDNLETAIRWVAPIDFHDQLLDMVSGRLAMDVELPDPRDFDVPIISTIPIFELAELLEEPFPVFDKSFSKIYVNRLKVPDCDLFQTQYYPSKETPIYRASLEGDELIIESLQEVKQSDLRMVLDSFAILNSGVHYEVKNYEQNIGKMTPMDETTRKDFIYNMTVRHNVYSLGRTACWRPSVLMDDCLKDCYQIRKMINSHRYDGRHNGS